MRNYIVIFLLLSVKNLIPFVYLFENVIHNSFPSRIKDGGRSRCKVKTSTHKTIVFLKSESINEFLLVK